MSLLKYTECETRSRRDPAIATGHQSYSGDPLTFCKLPPQKTGAMGPSAECIRFPHPQMNVALSQQQVLLGVWSTWKYSRLAGVEPTLGWLLASGHPSWCGTFLVMELFGSHCPIMRAALGWGHFFGLSLVLYLGLKFISSCHQSKWHSNAYGDRDLLPILWQETWHNLKPHVLCSLLMLIARPYHITENSFNAT